MSQIAISPQEITALRPLELHYFRIPRPRWEAMLTRVRQMGADAISTIVPWVWHEPHHGIFDLSGISHPTRDVTDFLETCHSMGFRVIIRISPYVGAGLLGGGVPLWLLAEHPEICALDADSQPRHDPTCAAPIPCAEHPTYLKYLERWYQEVGNTLTFHQPPAGPLVALRLDGAGPDISDPTHWDYNPHVIEVQWPIWLRQQYDGVEALNAAWKTDYRSISDAAFPRQPAASESSPLIEDALRFVVYASAHATDTYAHLLGEIGWRVPILTDPDASPKTLDLAHAVQVDPEPPQVGASLRWGLDAPVRSDGSVRRQFWAVKETLLGAEQGISAITGGTLVTGAESHRVRLPHPAGDYSLYRLLLNGGLSEASGRKRGETLLVDYVAADEAGETDMVLVLDDASAPLTGYLREYVTCLLMGRAGALQWTASMCQTLAEALSAATPPIENAERSPSGEDFLAAERRLAEARQAAQRAAASLGKLERLASQVRGEMPAASPSLLEPSAFSTQELERLTHVRDACGQVAPMLKETAQSIVELCQGGGALTIGAYWAAFEGARGTTKEADSILAEALGRLRADLAAETLSPVAWPLQDWLTRTLQGLTTVWLD